MEIRKKQSGIAFDRRLGRWPIRLFRSLGFVHLSPFVRGYVILSNVGDRQLEQLNEDRCIVKVMKKAEPRNFLTLKGGVLI